MSCKFKNNRNKLRAFICLQFIFSSVFCFSQLTQSLSSTNRIDGLIDVQQLNDSVLVGVLINNPINLTTSFASSIDSVIPHFFSINLNTKNVKKFPIEGDSMYFVSSVSASSFLYNNEFYFSTRKLNRLNFQSEFNQGFAPPNAHRILYKATADTIEKVTELYTNFTVRDINPFMFVNMEGNLINILSMNDLNGSKNRLIEYSFSGEILKISDTITAPIIHGIIQNTIDSSYHLFFANNTVHKLDKNLQILTTGSFVREVSTNRILQLPYFQSGVKVKKCLNGILKSSQIGDSICVASVRFIDDTTFLSLSKNLVLFNPLNINPNNYIYDRLYNGDNLGSSLFYFAYETKFCGEGSPNCHSTFTVIKQDTLNNNIWEKEFGGDAGYSVSRVLALKDSSCIVFVRRTNPITGNIDMHYVYINKNGEVESNFLPVLGTEEIVIPVKVTFSVFPNPTNEMLTLNNVSLEEKAKEIFILDYSGRIIDQLPFAKTVSVSQLQAGNYIYRLITQDGTSYETKFVKY